MSDMFRLYAGMDINEEWYNHTKTDEIKGGIIALLDSEDRSSTGRLRTLVEGTVKSLFTADGKEYEMTKGDYANIKIDDAWKIALELQKQFLNEEYPIMTESFFCAKCSRRNEERYTTIKTSWQKLIEDGIIDEVYLDSSDCRVMIELPVGLNINDSKAVTNGVYKEIFVEPLTLGELQKLVKIPALMENEGLMLCGIWDTKIKEIKGLSGRDLNILKRNPRDSFTRRYLIAKEDIDEMTDNKKSRLGLNAEFRSVSCQYCNNEIGGGLDYTNFFDFIVPKKLSRNLTQGRNV